MQAIQNTQTASTQLHNIFVVNEDTKKAGMLRKFIKERFQNKVNVYMYFSSKSCLRMIHENVHLVIIDYFNDSKKGNLLLKDIKALYPNMDVLIHTSNENITTAVDAMKLGASQYIVKNKTSWVRINEMVDNIIAQPLRILLAELGVSKMLGMFLLTFGLMAIVVLCVLKIMGVHYSGALPH